MQNITTFAEERSVHKNSESCNIQLGFKKNQLIKKTVNQNYCGMSDLQRYPWILINNFYITRPSLTEKYFELFCKLYLKVGADIGARENLATWKTWNLQEPIKLLFIKELSLCKKTHIFPYIFATLEYLIWQNLWCKISKVYNIVLQRYRDYKTSVCGKNSILFQSKH